MSRRWIRWSAAGSAYAVIVFLAGFCLGTLRIFVVAPRIGDVPAVAAEAPLMLLTSWIVCGWITRRFEMPALPRARLTMGIVAFLVLMLAEICVSVLAFGRSPSDHFAAYRSVAGMIGLSRKSLLRVFPCCRSAGKAGRGSAPRASRASPRSICGSGSRGGRLAMPVDERLVRRHRRDAARDDLLACSTNGRGPHR